MKSSTLGTIGACMAVAAISVYHTVQEQPRTVKVISVNYQRMEFTELSGNERIVAHCLQGTCPALGKHRADDKTVGPLYIGDVISETEH